MTPEEQLADQLDRTQRIADGWGSTVEGAVPSPLPRVKTYRFADVQDDPGAVLWDRADGAREVPVVADPPPVRYAVARYVGMTVVLGFLIGLGLGFTGQLGAWSDVVIVVVSAVLLNLGALGGESWLRLREKAR